MVFRLNRRRYCFLLAAVLAAVFCLPYFSSGFLAVEHDTFFHLSRIQGLADAVQRGDLLPALYPYKNNGFGYASPLFYCDLLLLPFSLLYLAGMPLAWTYKLVVFCATVFSAYAVIRLLTRVTDDAYAVTAVTAAFVFSNYRITDVYVRGALGEMMAIGFLAVIVSALHELLEKQNSSGSRLLFGGLCGLIFSHNLTFVFGVVIIIAAVLFYAGRINRRIAADGITAVVLAFLCTAWFTLPMLEQLGSQQFILHYYASSSQLERYAMPVWKYFANKTVFGFGENTLAADQQMLVNIGLPITACALLFPFCFLKNKKQPFSRFVGVTWLIGMVFFLLPLDIFPWASMKALRVIQFPWRLMTPALVLLTVPSAALLAKCFRRHTWITLCLCLLIPAEGLVHLTPAFSRPFGITSDTAYEDITSGALIDPYYSASYMRVELAGGDYLPIDAPDFRTLTPAVRTSDGQPAEADYTKDGTELTVQVTEVPPDGLLILPLTYYKGYEYRIGSRVLPAERSEDALVAIRVSEPGTVTVRYAGTPLRKCSVAVSLISAAAALLFYRKKKASH